MRSSPPPAPPLTSTLLTTGDGAALRLDVLSDQLAAPTALAIAPDGRVFVAEQEGRVRVFSNGVLDPQPAITIHEALMTSAAEGGLLALVLDSQFERTHFVYAVYTISGPEATRLFRVVRYREVDGRLGERVVLLDQVPAAPRPSAALGIGPDGQLYVAFDAGVSAGRTAALASYNGKVLRLSTDGTTPQDQPGNAPVFAGDVQSPRGLDWHPATAALWLADVRARDVEEVRAVTPGQTSNGTRRADSAARANGRCGRRLLPRHAAAGVRR